jgi:hypothetical protein
LLGSSAADETAAENNSTIAGNSRKAPMPRSRDVGRWSDASQIIDADIVIPPP